MAVEPGITQYLEAALRASNLRGKVIANNLANLHTPGFRRSQVEFEQALAQAMTASKGPDVKDFDPAVSQINDGQVNEFGNNVDIESEVGQLIKNSTDYQVYMRLMAKVYQQMDMAITGKID